GFNGTGSRQLALEPLEVGLRGAVLKLTSNLGLLCLSPAAAHGGTPSRNNGAAQYLGGSDLCVFIVLPTLYRARLSCAGRPIGSTRSTAQLFHRQPPGTDIVGGWQRVRIDDRCDLRIPAGGQRGVSGQTALDQRQRDWPL